MMVKGARSSTAAKVALPVASTSITSVTTMSEPLDVVWCGVVVTLALHWRGTAVPLARSPVTQLPGPLQLARYILLMTESSE